MKKLIILLILCSGMLLLIGAAPFQQAPPIPIQYGQTVTGTISDDQQIVSYVFDALGGDQITATLNATSGNLDPLLNLTNFNGTLLATDDNSGENGNARITYVIPANGAYLLNVTRSPVAEGNTIGNFELTLDRGIIPTATPESTEPTLPTVAPTLEATPDITLITPRSQRLQQLEIGTSVQGTLSGDNNFNLYWFEGRGGQTISITSDPTATFQPLLVLYRSDFSEIFRSQPGQTLSTTLPSDSLYFLATATIQSGVGGDYVFTLVSTTRPSSTPVASSGSGDGLVYGDTVTGTISNANPLVRYRFRGEAGDTVTITQSAISGDLDSYILLVDTSGNVVAQDDNSAGNNNAQVSTRLSTSGEYFVIATRRGQDQGITAGDFILELASDAPPRSLPTSRPNPPTDYADFPEISYGQTVAGEIGDAIYLQAYVFYGNAGDPVVITMDGADGLDSLLYLLDDQRIPLAEDDDISDTIKDARIEYTLPQDGYYGIIATRYDQENGLTRGRYELSLSLGSGTVGSDGTPLRVDPPVASRIVAGTSPTGNFDPLQFATIYSFSVAAGTLIDFAVTADNNIVSTVILTNHRLEFITASNNGILLAVSAPDSGDYYVIVAPQAGPAANISGGYSVILNAQGAGSNDGAAIPISYGSTVRGSVSDAQTEVLYVFQGREGDLVEVLMEAEVAPTPLDTYLILQDASGNVLAENDDIQAGVIRNSFLTAQLPADGEYIIVATRYSGTTGPITTGAFNLSLSYQDPTYAGVDRQADLMQYGDTVVGELTETTYLQFYYFDGRQTDTVIIQVTTTNGNLDAVLYLYALSSTGDPILLEANDDSPLGNTRDPYIEYTLPRSGGYMIAVTRYTGDDSEPTTGTYRLSLRQVQTNE